MSKHQEQMEALTAGDATAISNLQVPFEDRDYTTQQTLLILATGKTNFFENILPRLEHYLDGNRLKITGRSIKKYRELKLAEPRRKRPTEQLENRKTKKKTGQAPAKRQQGDEGAA